MFFTLGIGDPVQPLALAPQNPFGSEIDSAPKTVVIRRLDGHPRNPADRDVSGTRFSTDMALPPNCDMVTGRPLVGDVPVTENHPAES